MGEIIKMQKQSQLIDAIKKHDPVVLKSFYTSNYGKIESLVLKNSGNKEDAKDLYQEAFIAVWNNIKCNTFVPVNDTAIQGYLYTVAKNKWMDVVKSSRFKKTSNSIDEASINDDSNETDQDDVFNKNLNTTMEAFKILGQPCKQLLTTFYYEKKSLKDIALELNIEETTARNKKYRCMEKLRTMVLASK